MRGMAVICSGLSVRGIPLIERALGVIGCYVSNKRNAEGIC